MPRDINMFQSVIMQIDGKDKEKVVNSSTSFGMKEHGSNTQNIFNS